MPQFFLNKRLIILLVSIIVLVALIGFSLNGRKSITLPERFVKDSVGLVQATFHQPAQYVAGFFQNVGDLKRTYEENELLKSRLDEHMQLQAKARELEDENKKLQERLDKQDSLRKYEPIDASVIARNPERWHEVIALNRGRAHGVKENMAVITPQGLIGKIKHVSDMTSTVQLVSSLDRTNRISAIIQSEKKEYGLIEGYDEKKKALLLRRIPADAKIKEKELVITSGLGGVFPSGLPIGEIIEIEPDEHGLTQKAYVKPAADLYDLDHVVITTREQTADDLLIEEEEE
ncbi:rod shape-determining protein MreC [Metabacillus iocasae]|uniref:Cell shape-determining protein MreC n=1 Tax=Priestia iocasae TaxID=2291674 RepID=A0ABS2QPI9_9BACI|nr:rod shape-determining protein MreC [Metabacillus iocasae]MBM7701366.1 rod shape-determining protein MreC [Metabacillus iocasae]